jgi:ABC-type bacteriocin/lantibiotic exporter with double-glycine peptidase domain
MKRENILLSYFNNLRKLLSPKGVALIGVSLVATIVLAGAEYLIAIWMIVFLFILKIVESSKLPSWIFFDVNTLSPITVFLVLILVGVLRAGSQILSKQSGHALLELVRARLNMIQGYQMLVMDRQRIVPFSQVNMWMGECFPKTADYVLYSSELVSHVTLAVALGLGMLFIAWRETLLAVLCLACTALAILRLTKLLSHVAAQIPEEKSKIERALVRIYRNWLLIRIMRLKDREYRTYLDSVLAYFKFSQKVFWYQNVSAVLPPLLGILAIFVIIFGSVEYFKTLPVDLMAFIYLFVRFTQVTVGITEQVSALNRFRVQADESVKLISSLSPDELTAALVPEQGLPLFRKGKKLEEVRLTDLTKGDVSLVTRSFNAPEVNVCHITFSWPEATKPVFSDFSLHIPAGSRFGITGANGSGKSTLLGIILGILKPSSGRVLIGNVKSEDYIKTFGPVGFVGEDNYLIYGTIRENLLYGTNGQVADQEIWETLRLVSLENAIKVNTRVLDYMIQENGDGLSSGQKQRLALARAFLRRPSLLVLDEASANLDEEAEAELADILRKMAGRCTMIIVSHKPGILRNADYIFNLRNDSYGDSDRGEVLLEKRC